FALDRLDDDRRNLVRRDELVEQDLVEPTEVLDLAVRGVVDAGQQRAEAGVVLGLGGGQADRPAGPAVVGAKAPGHIRAPRRAGSQAAPRLDVVWPRVAEVRARAAV